MDPALRELLLEETDDPDRTIEAIVRLRDAAAVIPGVRVMARFGRIVTCRIRAGDVPDVWAHPLVESCKPGRGLAPEHEVHAGHETWMHPASADLPPSHRSTDLRRPPHLPLTGRRVLVAAVDWGLDFAADCFRRPDGSTRLLGLLDQRQPAGASASTSPYGYGTVHTPEAIDAALRTSHPYRALGYHCADADTGGGAHGTHVLDIAAGNGRSGGPVGIAPDADLAFVHLADRGTGGLANLGDSVRMLEAVDFVRQTAGDRPWVLNVSCGRHGGPHDGCTLTEMALDDLLVTTPGCFVVQSAGNYHRAGTHATGLVTQDGRRTLRFATHVADTTANEVEVWYPGVDAFDAVVMPPGAAAPVPVGLGEAAEIVLDGDVVGRAYHRDHDPNDGDHVLDVFLYPHAPAGEWTVTLVGRRVRDGRFHAWIERDSTCAACQCRFRPSDAVRTTTTGTLANGRLPLVVGAYDGHRPEHPMAPFSSSGPTRDGRYKPDLCAPGVDVLAARSAPREAVHSPNGLTRKSGTSMATPHVTGAVALCLEAGGTGMTARRIRDLVLGATRAPGPADDVHRAGRGLLDLPALVTALGGGAASRRTPLEIPMISPNATRPCGCGGHSGPEPEPVALLASAPATAYRELLYRPDGDLARWLQERFTVLSRPGEPVPTSTRPGDVLLGATLGSPTRGKLTVLDAPLAPDRRQVLPAGRLLLRPREAEQPREGADEPFGEELLHVIQARRLWREMGLPSGVTIRDMGTAPSMLTRGGGFLAWTNSPDSVYVSMDADAEPGRLRFTVFHEAIHIKQFRDHNLTRPPSYAHMMRFECDAYTETARWAERHQDADVRRHTPTLRANAAVFCKEIEAAKRARLSLTRLNARYKDFLVRGGSLPEHQDIADLYRTFPERETLDTESDAEDVDLARVWRDVGGPSGVTIHDLDDLPNAALRDFIVANKLAAWTNSGRDVYVIPALKENLVAARVAFHHEAEHIRQFREPVGAEKYTGPPPSWAHMMTYECDAYRASVRWIDSQHDASLAQFLAEMRTHATRICREIDRAKAARLRRPALEERYRKFLVKGKYVPAGFTDVLDLYRSQGGAGDAEGGYEDLLTVIEAELRHPYPDPDDPELHQRRLRLRGLFASIPKERKRELLHRLGERPTRDELSRLFHHRLHSATRRELLDILRRGIPPTPAPAPPAPAFVNPHDPLPASAQPRYDAAVRTLRAKIDASKDPRAWRYRCWLDKLATAADDRVIPWSRICPITTGAIGAAMLVGPCDISHGLPVPQQDLKAAVRTVGDVERAGRQLSFITHLRPQILWITELTSDQFHLENFRHLHDQVVLSITNFEKWRDNQMGGSSAMPREYRAIMAWIRQRQGDANSLYSCM